MFQSASTPVFNPGGNCRLILVWLGLPWREIWTRELMFSAVLIGRCGVRGFPLFVNKISRRISSLFLHFPELWSSCRVVKSDFLHLGMLALLLEIYNGKSEMFMDWATYTVDLNICVVYKFTAFVPLVGLLRWFEVAGNSVVSEAGIHGLLF